MKDIWDKKYANVPTYIITNSLGSCFVMMAVFGKGLQDMDAAFKAMEELKPIKQVDFTGTMEKQLLSGEVHVGLIHRTDTTAPVSWAAPKEGVMALEQVYSVTREAIRRNWLMPLSTICFHPKYRRSWSRNSGIRPRTKR